MKDQVVTPRTAARAAASARSRTAMPVQQRPIRRVRVADNSQAVQSVNMVRRVLGWIPRAVKIVLAIGFAVLIFAGYRAAASASFFQVRNIDVSGASKTSPDQIKSIVRRLGGAAGVWNVDLNVMSSEIGQLTWVRSAIVSRVLPDGVRVRIVERTPIAVTRLSNGRFFWVDDDATVLGEAIPSEKLPDFFIRGWAEGRDADSKAENRDRVLRFQTILKDFNANGYSNRVSELDLTDLSDIRVQLAGEDADVSVRIGKEDFANHFKGAVARLDEAKRENPGLRILYVDNSMGSRVTLGTDRQIVKPLADSATASSPAKQNQTPKGKANTNTSAAKPKPGAAQHANSTGRIAH